METNWQLLTADSPRVGSYILFIDKSRGHKYYCLVLSEENFRTRVIWRRSIKALRVFLYAPTISPNTVPHLEAQIAAKQREHNFALGVFAILFTSIILLKPYKATTCRLDPIHQTVRASVYMLSMMTTRTGLQRS